MILAIRGPGDLLGEQSALDGLPRSATAIALDDVSALVLARGDFLAFLGGHPLTGLVLLTMLSQRLREADLKRVGLSVQDTVARLAERIVELAERFGEDVDGTVEISLPMSQDDLASWSGCFARLGREGAADDALARLGGNRPKADHGAPAWTSCAAEPHRDRYRRKARDDEQDRHGPQNDGQDASRCRARPRVHRDLVARVTLLDPLRVARGIARSASRT